MILAIGIALALVGVAAWIVAIASAIGIMRLMPAGTRFSGWQQLGGWRFRAIEAAAGPNVRPLIRRYVTAFAIFIAAVVASTVASVLLSPPAIRSASTTAMSSHKAVPVMLTAARTIDAALLRLEN